MDRENFFIKNGYISQERNKTLLLNAEESFWNEERIYFSNYYQWDVYAFAKHVLIKSKARKVVDVGCGVATKLMKLIHPLTKEIVGVDREEAIEICRDNYEGGTFIVDDLENPQVEHGPYDLVICSDVIEHLFNPDILVTYIKKISHKDTLIIFSTPERDILRGKGCMKSEKPDHVREWNRKEFKAYLEDRGFQIMVHRLSPFIKFSLKSRVYKMRSEIIKRCGTVKTNQLVLCRLK
jgi:2-polyprenyl-3-methyl-5-hydroxy-6-metoxy-1,4-benzoquinol methylase